MNWNKTSDCLPGPEYHNIELLGYGKGISGHINGNYSIMRYDGNWWNKDGTVLSDPPESWTHLVPPNNAEQLG